MSTKTKKTNATAEGVLGQSAQHLTKAVAEMLAAVDAVKGLSAKGEELTLLVANKEEAIVALDVQYKEKERQLQVDLDLSFKANTDRVVNEYLKSVNKVSISTADLNSLQKELADTKAGAEAETKKQVAVVSSALKSQYENEIKLIQSENKTQAVENQAKIGTLAEQKAFLEKQVEMLIKQLDAERNAGIERAKAGSVGTINVGSNDRK